MKQFDVVVVGGGHAGCEAAHAAARMGAETAIVTMTNRDFGIMSCNPAIGGLGKGHLVREVDALDGLMGRAADAAGIQFRLLNRRKGPAVQGPRAQADRSVYSSWMSRVMKNTPHLTNIYGEVVDLTISRGAVTGVELADGTSVSAKSVVITTGTFLGGTILIGGTKKSGGRMGDAASNRLSARFRGLELPLGRLKTGTPPRLDRKTIDWQSLAKQPGDDDPAMFSFLGGSPALKQVPCYITHTNKDTHAIIRANLASSSMYGGHVKGVGPRYCPSIEDKIVRFADKESHQVFLEPEGLNADTVYPNGISTSLPPDIQREYVRSMNGLEKAEILQPGYAIEYDYVDPRSLDHALAVRCLGGLFLAGQINGTTGYEEAAAQGLVAGINATRHARGVTAAEFSRTDSYIGVMIDDLVSRGVTEPYRMFTSRAEYRLSLRADNADQRLTPIGEKLGCVSEARTRAFNEKMNELASARTVLQHKEFTPTQLNDAGIQISLDGRRRTALELLGISDVSASQVVALDAELKQLPEGAVRQLARDALYANYLDRQSREIDAIRSDEALKIPADFDYRALSGLSGEISNKLSDARPASVGHASRIEGMTPAALIVLIGALKQRRARVS